MCTEDLKLGDIILIIIILIYNMLLTLISLIYNFTILYDNYKIILFGESEIFLLVSKVFMAGIIGGSFYTMRALYQRVGYSQTPTTSEHFTKINIKAWFIWYLYRPIQSGILAAITVCLFDQGILYLNGNGLDMNSLYFQVAIGFLVGFGAHEVIQKVEEIIKVIFSKSNKGQNKNSKDRVIENKEREEGKNV